MKGVTFQHHLTPTLAPDFEIWNKPVDRVAPNARSVIPNITNKCVTCAYMDDHRGINLDSIVRGCAYHDYPKVWWLQPMRMPHMVADMQALLPHCMLKNGLGRACQCFVKTKQGWCLWQVREPRSHTASPAHTHKHTHTQTHTKTRASMHKDQPHQSTEHTHTHTQTHTDTS